MDMRLWKKVEEFALWWLFSEEPPFILNRTFGTVVGVFGVVCWCVDRLIWDFGQ
jgi:hypothetical protein